jgi:hypothetical protein
MAMKPASGAPAPGPLPVTSATGAGNLNSRLCLSVPSASTSSGVQLEQFHCGGLPQPASPFVDQLWHF